MRELGLPCEPKGWAQAWDSCPNSGIEEVISRYIPEGSIVVSWGLSNIILRSLEATSIKYLDFDLSSIRFTSVFLGALERMFANIFDVLWVPDEQLSAVAAELTVFQRNEAV